MEHLNLQALADNLSLFAFIYLCVFGAIVMDLWSGVRKARRRHELRMSNGYKRTVDKIARYYNMLLVVSIMDALLIVSQAHSFCSLPCLPYLTIIGALFLCFIELKTQRQRLYGSAVQIPIGPRSYRLLQQRPVRSVLRRPTV
ncbi:hypothetical protein [Alistipes indistinctus]|uniref:hypothetical protein n=1 Tax=Alistipes indistinctus TaxID=626932 RepID=UPI0036F31F3D